MLANLSLAGPGQKDGSGAKRSLINVSLAIGLLVGMTAGLFGVGGGIILVPLLVLLFKTDQKKAQATSLVVVSLSAVTGATT